MICFPILMYIYICTLFVVENMIRNSLKYLSNIVSEQRLLNLSSLHSILMFLKLHSYGW